MTDHDPMCPWDKDELPGRQHCACYLIAKARADEREKDRQLMRNALDNERERIARAIEAEVDLWWIPQCDAWGIVVTNAARIARNGGSNE